MAVTIRKVVVSDTGAGEPLSDHHHKLQTSAIAYSYTRLNGYLVTVSKPIIDRLTFTVPVPHELQTPLVKSLGELAVGLSDMALQVSKASKTQKKGSTKYLQSYEVAFKHSKVLLQAKPHAKKSNFLRVEMNPAALRQTEISAVWEFLCDITKGHLTKATVAKNAKITRIDVAVDMLNIDPEDIIVAHEFSGKTNAYFGADGKVETIYFNKKTKGSQTYLYDKKIQLKEGGKPSSAGPNEYGEAKYTRLERRVQTQKKFGNLVSLPNPLKKLDLLVMDGVGAPGEAYVWRLFQDACRYRGLTGAMKLLPKKEQKAFQESIEKSSGLLWRPDDIWSFWKDSLKTSGLLMDD